ncbi:glycosyltransferase [Vibrio sp. B1FLJ16]|uniref:glycosyltransferase n=1 Tax=Vibrio sp. B1FLJ16 TaxID=2751178 RepID=UPI0015F63F6E|nr:glycosyltransferase [Vibrio sp. B1FLJ16]CAD7807348.1 Glycosyl transferases group 1 [Vibrio sp. B1FLJ16]CAE6905425.1 Glycosyl transferases group 1 [Vibrio sp. B1FLJ16]
MKIVFILPVAGGGGGAHSVIQEANEMISMGINVHIAVNSNNLMSMKVNYADMPLVLGRFIEFSSDEDLASKIESGSIVVATIFTSVKILKAILKINDNIIPAYYVQDYEPLFSEKDSPLWKEAYDSYTSIPNLNIFTKTKWQQNIVFKNHGVKVSKVEPSIDHSVYFPNLNYNKLRLSAMVRPKSARRAPYRTMRILRAIKKAIPYLSIDIFGCSDNDLIDSNVVRDFEFTNHGVLKRVQVASLLRNSGMFLDASDFQAFGRTSLEAMACGCVPAIPSVGGGYEYAEDEVNSYVCDMQNEAEVVNSIIKFFHMSELDRKRIVDAAIDKSQEFSVRKAALSEIRFFSSLQ